MTAPRPDFYHQPVLPVEVVTLVKTDPEGAYLDLTAGGGGHLKLMAAQLGPKARLYGIDRDPQAVAFATNVLQTFVNFKRIVCASYVDVGGVVKQFEDQTFTGILLDLGISSRQIDDPARGFSFSQDGPLDMRMGPDARQTAAELLYEIDERKLAEILSRYGEEQRARNLAQAIVRERRKKMIATTSQLSAIIASVVRPPHQTKSLARVFQALRIAVNHELDQLEAVLPASFDLLRSGGRLAVISYHSLEDRLVKQFMQGKSKGRCTCPRDLAVCVCGATPTGKAITKKPVIPTDSEQAENSRSRSAKLRVLEKL
ncbi:MAG: 16S rRNA (cytosine(1402)-N(4))-methyltransferase RsmH [Candidatus Zixiibacteriota bacterium]